MSNYNQYYYKGDTINARVVEDGFAVDLTDDNVRSKMYDDEYRLGVGAMLNSVYERKFGHKSGMSDNSVSLEILGHAAGYDFATGLDGLSDKVALTNSPFIAFPAWELKGKQWLYDKTKEANMGKTDTERILLDPLGKFVY